VTHAATPPVRIGIDIGGTFTDLQIFDARTGAISGFKTLTTPDFLLALRNGQDFQTATLIMDTTNNIVTPLFSKSGAYGIEELSGFPDSILVPDPTTFRLLPWSSGTGWILSDMYFQSGRPVPFCSRQIMKGTLATLRERGFDYMAGLEVEFYLTKLEDRKLTAEQSGWPPDAPTVSTVAHGFLTTLPGVTPGPHTLCVDALNAATQRTRLGCHTL